MAVLKDDNDGSRHQKIYWNPNAMTVLVAHNIDLAITHDGLKRDTVWFQW